MKRALGLFFTLALGALACSPGKQILAPSARQ